MALIVKASGKSSESSTDLDVICSIQNVASPYNTDN